jgi:hypothetical protein
MCRPFFARLRGRDSQCEDGLDRREQGWYVERLKEDLCGHVPILTRIEWRLCQ